VAGCLLKILGYWQCVFWVVAKNFGCIVSACAWNLKGCWQFCYQCVLGIVCFLYPECLLEFWLFVCFNKKQCVCLNFGCLFAWIKWSVFVEIFKVFLLDCLHHFHWKFCIGFTRNFSVSSLQFWMRKFLYILGWLWLKMVR